MSKPIKKSYLAVGWTSLILGMLVVVAPFVIDPKSPVGKWLDTWGDPTMYVDDPGDGMLVLAFFLNIILYLIGYFTAIAKQNEHGPFGAISLFIASTTVYYLLTFVLVVAIIQINLRMTGVL